MSRCHSGPLTWSRAQHPLFKDELDHMSRYCLIYDAHLLFYIFTVAAVILFIYHCLLTVLWRKVGQKWGVLPEEEEEGNIGTYFNEINIFLFF